jgi:hypothetical protein
MRLRLGHAALLAIAGTLVVGSPARAERIILRNGHDIKECWIIEETKAEIVVAVIRKGNVGKMSFSPTEIESIDRSREITLEEALVKARRALEDEARRKALEAAAAAAAAAASTTTARPEGDAKKSGAAAGKDGGKGSGEREGASLIPPTSPEEDEKIAGAIKEMGDARKIGGAATRREVAVRTLIDIGLKTLPAVSDALGDADNSYRRMNAARVIADISGSEKRLEAYEDVVPKLIGCLGDPVPWVRVSANRALEAITDAKMGYPEPDTSAGDDISQGEKDAADKWKTWWDEKKKLLAQ